MVSRKFPAWVLGKNPDARVAMTSYGADLAEDNSRAVRILIESDRFANVFGDKAAIDRPIDLSSDSRAVSGWDLAAPNRGGMAATGVGGPLTGKGAHLLIVDDPVKNREDAESEKSRERLWDWWTSTAYTRLENSGAVVIIQTRWHGDDLAGRLLTAMADDPKADQYVVLSLMDRWEEPAIPEGKSWEEFHLEQLREGVWADQEDPLGRKEGEALWPEKYNEDDLERIEANVGPYDYAALYRQTPFAKAGRKFLREWFVIVNDPPKPEEIVDRIRFWDKAGTKDAGAFTCGVLMSRTVHGLIYVEHVERGQWESATREERIMETAQADSKRPGPTIKVKHEREGGSSGLDSAQATNARLARGGFDATFELPSGDKIVRAGPWASAGMAGIIRLVKGSWNKAYVDEHVSFPKGKYKDQVDASSGAYKDIGILGLDGQLFY